MLDAWGQSEAPVQESSQLAASAYEHTAKVPKWYIRTLCWGDELEAERLKHAWLAAYDGLLCEVLDWDHTGVWLFPASGEGYTFWVDYEDADLVYDPSAKDLVFGG